MFDESAALPFVNPTRISCHAAVDKARMCLSLKERRTKRDNATKIQSGVARWRDLRPSPILSSLT